MGASREKEERTWEKSATFAEYGRKDIASSVISHKLINHKCTNSQYFEYIKYHFDLWYTRVRAWDNMKRLRKGNIYQLGWYLAKSPIQPFSCVNFSTLGVCEGSTIILGAKRNENHIKKHREIYMFTHPNHIYFDMLILMRWHVVKLIHITLSKTKIFYWVATSVQTILIKLNQNFVQLFNVSFYIIN